MAKCAEDCTCGRHTGPWTGKKRPDLIGKQPNLKHGHTGEDPVTGKKWVSLTYKSWQSMKYRCEHRGDYMAKGIRVDPHWLVFANFLADMGERPGPEYSIDRWPNNQGDYRPGNCRWATKTEQVHNRGSFIARNQFSESRGLRHSDSIGR